MNPGVASDGPQRQERRHCACVLAHVRRDVLAAARALRLPKPNIFKLFDAFWPSVSLAKPCHMRYYDVLEVSRKAKKEEIKEACGANLRVFDSASAEVSSPCQEVSSRP